MNLKKKMLAAAMAIAVPMIANAGSVLIVNNSLLTSEFSTTSAVTNNLQALHIAVGNTVAIVSDIPVSLAGYNQVWDVSFSNNAALTGQDQAEYLAFMQGGGGLFLMGENSSFMTRNNSILSLITAAGGGTIGFNPCFDGAETVRAPFTGPNAVASVTYAASGCFTGTGTGDWITARADNSMGAGLAFGVGDLANAPTGALTTILDVNFMMNQYDVPASQNLTKNLIGFVGDQVNPNPIPEPGTLALASLALMGVLGSRRRRA